MHITQITDEQLVELSLSGTDAFREIVRRYHRKVYDVAFRMVRNREDAEDITQEAFLRAYQYLKQYDKKYKFTNWLLKIATNLTINHLKKRRSQPILMEEDKLKEVCQTNNDANQDIKVLEGKVNQALDSLLPHYKMAFVLVYQEDYAYQEAATIMGLPLGSFKTYIHKARDIVINAITDK